MYFGMQPFVYMIISCPVLNAHCGRYCFNFVSNLIITRHLQIHTPRGDRGLKRLEKVVDHPAEIDFLNFLSPSSTLDAYQYRGSPPYADFGT